MATGKLSSPQSHLFPFSDFRTQALVLVLVGLVFYFNSFFNEFALDDGIVIIKNEYVQQGIGGLGKIFTKDAYDSFYRQMNAKDQLSGGRYRPLSIATFALEQEVIGLNPQGGAASANCWDTNKNGKQDIDEDINGDGLYNEYDCSVRGMHITATLIDMHRKMRERAQSAKYGRVLAQSPSACAPDHHATDRRAAVKKVEELMASDHGFAEDIELLRRTLAD